MFNSLLLSNYYKTAFAADPLTRPTRYDAVNGNGAVNYAARASGKLNASERGFTLRSVRPLSTVAMRNDDNPVYSCSMTSQGTIIRRSFMDQRRKYFGVLLQKVMKQSQWPGY